MGQVTRGEEGRTTRLCRLNRAGIGNASKRKERVHSIDIHEHYTHFIYMSPCISLYVIVHIMPPSQPYEVRMTHSFSFILWLVFIYDDRKMKLFESEQIIDMDPYVSVLKIRAWVLDNFEISVEHTPHWYLKDPLLLRPKDFSLVNVPLEPIVPYPSPPALPTKSSQVLLDVGVIDLTFDTEEED
ncbi:hypothetical protein CJ030_MR3G017023 [Morella rubra]|uniref:Uncharacterized protein n=1 Tax=Morella rubra TaxID=262757 RepID=A0A6A1W4M8_9ROSI|nr:hypothetical protein CJ030_MR3G017023 [Morella rubra]